MNEDLCDDEWEVFTGYRHNRNSGNWRHIPIVTLLARGDISLNEKAVEILGTSYVSLAFDRTKRIIRITGVSEKRRDSTAIRQGAGRSSVISAARFTRHFGIHVQKAQRYRAEVRGDELYISLEIEG